MTFEFKTLEIKSPTGILWLVIASGLTIMGTILLFVTTDNLILRVSVSAPMTLALPLTLMYMLTSKVKFEEDKVVKTSIFGSTELRFENINSFGVLSQSRYSCWLVDADNVNENDLLSSDFIFLSESYSFDLNSKKPKRNIRLLFRKDVYEKIKEYVKKASAQQRA